MKTSGSNGGCVFGKEENAQSRHIWLVSTNFEDAREAPITYLFPCSLNGVGCSRIQGSLEAIARAEARAAASEKRVEELEEEVAGLKKARTKMVKLTADLRMKVEHVTVRIKGSECRSVLR